MPEMGTQKTPPTSVTRTSLADALSSGTQQRVLGLLFGQPDRSFYANEVISLANAGSGAVQRELARLAQSGLVTTRGGGQPEALPGQPGFTDNCGTVRDCPQNRWSGRAIARCTVAPGAAHSGRLCIRGGRQAYRYQQQRYRSHGCERRFVLRRPVPCLGAVGRPIGQGREPDHPQQQ